MAIGMEQQRRATVAAWTGTGLVALGLWLAFWVALEPGETGGCRTTLVDSAFKSALVPAHLAAAAVLTACLLALSRGPRTTFVLGGVWAYIVGCVIAPAFFFPAGLAGLVIAPLLGPLALLALLIRLLLLLRSSEPAEARWRDHVVTARVLVWGALVLGLPASFVYAWFRGAEIFCF